MKELFSKNPAQTKKIAKRFARILQPGDVTGLQGDLAAGKTVFIKSIADYFGINSKKITSTSFVIIKEHLTKHNTPFYHIDLYRLNSGKIPDEFYDIIYKKDGFIFIEWSNRADIPVSHFLIDIQLLSLKRRKIIIQASCKELQKRLPGLTKE